MSNDAVRVIIKTCIMKQLLVVPLISSYVINDKQRHECYILFCLLKKEKRLTENLLIQLKLPTKSGNLSYIMKLLVAMHKLMRNCIYFVSSSAINNSRFHFGDVLHLENNTVKSPWE